MSLNYSNYYLKTTNVKNKKMREKNNKKETCIFILFVLIFVPSRRIYVPVHEKFPILGEISRWGQCSSKIFPPFCLIFVYISVDSVCVVFCVVFLFSFFTLNISINSACLSAHFKISKFNEKTEPLSNVSKSKHNVANNGK